MYARVAVTRVVTPVAGHLMDQFCATSCLFTLLNICSALTCFCLGQPQHLKSQ